MGLHTRHGLLCLAPLHRVREERERLAVGTPGAWDSSPAFSPDVQIAEYLRHRAYSVPLCALPQLRHGLTTHVTGLSQDRATPSGNENT